MFLVRTYCSSPDVDQRLKAHAARERSGFYRRVDRPGVPAGWLGALLVLLLIALSPTTIGPLALLLPAGALAPFVYLGGLLGAVWFVSRELARGHPSRPAGRLRRAGATLIVVGIAATVLVTATLALMPGPGDGLVPYNPAFDGPRPPTALTDPGEPGPFEVETLTYGSGTDRHRAAFGADADLQTASVDAAAILPRFGHGSDEARAWFWGFDTDALPIQGIAWIPVGAGPYPLVLIVHGNHAMGDFSEDGYAYLGRHLATRGFIAVSVDENFLNGSWADDWMGQEQLARAWLLLLHLDQWRTWSADSSTPLSGRVDMERVALIGHSRGGESAAVAASISSRTDPPDARLVSWPTGLDIDAVVSLAPSHGQYSAGARLSGVDYLTIAGGYDADARGWSGIRQYAVSTPDDGGFKAALWAYRANHGQFNTRWGRDDGGPMSQLLLDVAPLLTAEEQQDLARTAIGAFLEGSLHGQTGYRGLFRRPMVGREWLPPDIVLVRSAEGGGLALTKGGHPVEGLAGDTRRATVDRARSVPLRALQPDQSIVADLLHWERGDGVASWSMTGLDRLSAAGGLGTVSLSIADGREPGDVPLSPLDISFVARTTSGREVSVEIGQLGSLPPPLPVHLVKDATVAGMAGIDVSLRSPVERVLQTYVIDVAALAGRGGALTPVTLSEIEIRVERSSDGALWIAEPTLSR